MSQPCDCTQATHNEGKCHGRSVSTGRQIIEHKSKMRLDVGWLLSTTLIVIACVVTGKCS